MSGFGKIELDFPVHLATSPVTSVFWAGRGRQTNQFVAAAAVCYWLDKGQASWNHHFDQEELPHLTLEFPGTVSVSTDKTNSFCKAQLQCSVVHKFVDVGSCESRSAFGAVLLRPTKRMRRALGVALLLLLLVGLAASSESEPKQRLRLRRKAQALRAQAQALLAKAQALGVQTPTPRAASPKPPKPLYVYPRPQVKKLAARGGPEPVSPSPSTPSTTTGADSAPKPSLAAAPVAVPVVRKGIVVPSPAQLSTAILHAPSAPQVAPPVAGPVAPQAVAIAAQPTVQQQPFSAVPIPIVVTAQARTPAAPPAAPQVGHSLLSPPVLQLLRVRATAHTRLSYAPG